MPKASLLRSSSRSSKRSATKLSKRRREPKHFASHNGGRRRYYLREIMIALASASATLRTHEMFTLPSLSAAYTAAICLQLLRSAVFCRNGDRRGTDHSQDLISGSPPHLAFEFRGQRIQNKGLLSL